MQTVEIIISGRVQGVGFRWFTVDLARRLGVTGTVQNLSNGDVRVLAVSDDDALSSFVSGLRKGPSMARVTDIQVHPANPTITKDTFDVVY